MLKRFSWPFSFRVEVKGLNNSFKPQRPFHTKYNENEGLIDITEILEANLGEFVFVMKLNKG